MTCLTQNSETTAPDAPPHLPTLPCIARPRFANPRHPSHRPIASTWLHPSTLGQQPAQPVQPLQRALDLELHLIQLFMSMNRKTTRRPCNRLLARPHGRASHEATGPPNPPTTAGLRDLWSTQVVVVSGTMVTSHEAQTLGEETP